MSKASLPDREKQICRRVRVARELKGKTQQQCAELTGIERSTLANYEAEITPLGYDQAKRICYRLNINQWWFATGESPFAPYFDLSPNLEFSIKQNALFSEAFDTVLKARLREQIDTLVKWIGVEAYFSGKFDDAVLDGFHLTGEEPGEAAGFYVQKVISMRFHWMPEVFRIQYAKALIKAEESFWKKYGSEIEKQIRERRARDAVAHLQLEGENKSLKSGAEKQVYLDNPPKPDDTASVKPQRRQFKSLSELMDAVREMVKERGQKTALAKELGVSRQAVDQWLSGAAKPSAELTFELLNRVK